MNERIDFERTVAGHIASEGVAPPSDAFHDELFSRADRHGQRPRWLALMKEPPMRTNSRLVVGSPAVRVAAIIVATLLLTAAIAGAGIAGQRLLAAGDPIIVAQDGTADHTTITTAIEAAADGDTILVRAGTYDEALLITEDITIRGDGDREAIVLERAGELPQGLGKWGDPGLPYAVRLEHADASLENLTVRGEASRISIVGGSPTLDGLTIERLGILGSDAGAGDSEHDDWMIGLELVNGTRATLRDSRVIDTHIAIDTAASPVLEANVISGGFTLMQGAGVSPVVRDNAFKDAKDESLWVGGGATAEIAHNAFSNARWAGVVVADAEIRPDGPPRAGTDAVIHDNTFRDCGTGVELQRWTSATIEGNDIGGSDSGITITEADAVVTGNVVRDGRTGVHVVRGEPSLTDNSISGNSVGLVIERPARPVMTGNTVCDNDTNVRLMGGATMPETDGDEICPDD